jgi:hypothetical protein
LMKKFLKNPLYELHWILLVTKWQILTHTPQKKKKKYKQKHWSLAWIWRREFNEIVAEITELGMMHDPSPSSKSGPKWTSTYYHLTTEDGWWYVDRKHFFITFLFETWPPWLSMYSNHPCVCTYHLVSTYLVATKCPYLRTYINTKLSYHLPTNIWYFIFSSVGLVYTVYTYSAINTGRSKKHTRLVWPWGNTSNLESYQYQFRKYLR